MIAKCKNCNFVRITRMRRTCPHCTEKLTRPTVQELHELQSLGEHAMERSRAVRPLLEYNNSSAMRLAAFMAIFHGRHLTEHQATQMLKS